MTLLIVIVQAEDVGRLSEQLIRDGYRFTCQRKRRLPDQREFGAAGGRGRGPFAGGGRDYRRHMPYPVVWRAGLPGLGWWEDLRGHRFYADGDHDRRCRRLRGTGRTFSAVQREPGAAGGGHSRGDKFNRRGTKLVVAIVQKENADAAAAALTEAATG